MNKIYLFFSILYSFVLFSQQDVPQQERDELVKLYTSTVGTEWKQNTNWNSLAPVEQWYGIQVATQADGTKNVVSIDLANNNLTGTINLDNLPHLEKLIIDFNKFTELKLNGKGLPKLKYLFFYNNYKIGNLELNDLPSLQSVIANDCKQLISVKCHNLPELIDFQSDKCFISKAEFINTPKLEKLMLKGNQLESIDISSLNKLNTLYLDRNKLTSLDLSVHSELQYLELSENANLTEIKLNGRYPNLKRFISNSTNLQHLNNLGELPSLVSLELSNNKNLTGDFDLSKSVNLQELKAAQTKINTFNLKNGRNNLMGGTRRDSVGKYINLGNQITCIAVDNPTSANSNALTYKRWYVLWKGTRNYKSDCTEHLSNVEVKVEKKFSIVNPAKERLIIKGQEPVKSVKVYDTMGRLVKSFSTNDSYIISDLAKGIYLVVINDQNTMKVIKE